MERAKQLYDEAIGLDFLNKFGEGIYVTEIGLAPLTRPAGTRGFQLMLESASRGYAPAQFQLGLYYLFDHYHRENAVNDIKDEMERFLALRNLEDSESQSGVSLLENAAKQNYGAACLLLGDIYSETTFCGGITSHISRSNLRAFEYYKMGAQAGNEDAMYRLGRCYYYGEGTEESNNDAFFWFCRARDAGCELMWALLGDCYMNGFGAQKDIPLAINAFESDLKVQNSGFHNSATLKLACIYLGECGFEYANYQKVRELASSISNSDADDYQTAQDILSQIPTAEAQCNQWKAATRNAASTQKKSSGGCYVATAVYGSYDCPEVWTLRRFRDFTLAETWYGRAFIRTYYAISPTLVKHFGATAWFRKLWKPALDQMVEKLNKNGVSDTPYDDHLW